MKILTFDFKRISYNLCNTQGKTMPTAEFVDRFSFICFHKDGSGGYLCPGIPMEFPE